MLGENKRAAILEMHKQGHGILCIARVLGASRTAIRHVINAGTAECGLRGRIRVESHTAHRSCNGFCPAIIIWCECMPN